MEHFSVMAGPLLSEDGELEDGEVQTEGAAEAEVGICNKSLMLRYTE